MLLPRAFSFGSLNLALVHATCKVLSLCLSLSLAFIRTSNFDAFPAGFYVALAQGYYTAADLSVNLLDPAQDAYKSTPASRVASGQATFAVAPSETVVSYNSQPRSSAKPRLQVTAPRAYPCRST